jgi:hypothetical protein
MAEMEMERALAKMKLGPKKDPSQLLNKLASIECKYSLELQLKEESTSAALRGVIIFEHHCNDKHDLSQKEQNFNL